MWPEIDASGGPSSRQPDRPRWDDGYRWTQIFITAVPSYVSNSQKGAYKASDHTDATNWKVKGRRRNDIGRCDLVNVPLEILDVRSLGRFYGGGNAFSASHFV